MEDQTVPVGSSRRRFRRLRIEVVEGPDAGLAAEGADRLGMGSAQGNDLVLRDETVSKFHAEIRREGSKVALVDLGSTNGTVVGGAWIHHAWLSPGTMIRLGHTQVRLVDGESEETELFPNESLAGVLGRSSPMRELMTQVRRAAASEASVLVLGETGTGKEVIARAIHELSARSSQPFETVDCGSVIPTLIASELFGHEKGAFTGAERQHQGAFERANGGTIFLDEVGELPASLQVALLGALERRSFRRLGGKERVEVDVRVLAATNRDLRAEVNAGTFRADLFYRLAVVHLIVPPLRDRLDDIPLLAEHFLGLSGFEGPLSDVLDEAALAGLQAHRWPGNVRELRNVIQATVAMGAPPRWATPTPAPSVSDGSGELPPTHGLHLELGPLIDLTYPDARAAALDRFEAMYVQRLVERTGGNVSKAARQGRLNRSYLNKLMKRHGVRAQRE